MNNITLVQNSNNKSSPIFAMATKKVSAIQLLSVKSIIFNTFKK